MLFTFLGLSFKVAANQYNQAIQDENAKGNSSEKRYCKKDRKLCQSCNNRLNLFKKKKKKVYPALFPVLYNIQPRSFKDHLEKFSSDV